MVGHKRYRHKVVSVLAVMGVILFLPLLGFSQVDVACFRFPDREQPEVWRLDVYFSMDLSGLRPPRRDRQDGYVLHVEVVQPDGRLISGNQFEIDPHSLSADPLTTDRLFELNTSFHLYPGDYRVRWRLTHDGGSSVSKGSTSVHLPKRRPRRVEMSDLVPVNLPYVTEPPFDKLFWVEKNPLAIHFLLYYEVFTANPDTVVEFRMVLKDARGGVVRTEHHSLYVFNGKRQDYLIVDLETLPVGGYTVELSTTGGGVDITRMYSFTKVPALPERTETDVAMKQSG